MAKTIFVKAARKFAGKCETCLRNIDKGDGYKWIGVRQPGAIRSERRIRCEGCDDWHEWDYNPSIASQCKRVMHDTDFVLRYSKTYSTPHGARVIMHVAAGEIEIFANTREVSRDRASRVFGEKNFRVKQFTNDVYLLRAWAKTMRHWDSPPLPEPELTDCDLCALRPLELPSAYCPNCHGEGQYVPDQPTNEQLDEWRTEVADSANEVLELCPL